MKTRTSKSSLIGINLILTIVGIGLLYVASLFWMGSKEDYENLANNSYWSFFANRLFFNLLIGLMMIALIGVINWIGQKITKVKMSVWKILAIDSFIFVVCSIIFIAVQLSQ
jgi:hypothetical protein